MLVEMIGNIILHHAVVHLQKIEDPHLIAHVTEVEIMNTNGPEVIESPHGIETINTSVTHESNHLVLRPFPS